MTPRLQRARGIVLIVLATGVAFCNVFPNAFHLDDFYRVVGNPGIQQVHPTWRRAPNGSGTERVRPPSDSSTRRVDRVPSGAACARR